MDKVSIIIPCYNDKAYVKEAVRSAINQTWSNKEIIIVDDGSNKKTKKILKELTYQVDLLITQDNMGASAARNRGIDKAEGKYILVLDADDSFAPEFIEEAVAILAVNSEVKLVTCFARWFISDKNYSIFKPTGGNFEKFLLKNSSLGTMFRKLDWKRIGGYDENMKKGWEDREFYLRILKNGGHAHVIPKVLFNYRIKKNSKTTVANKNRNEIFQYIILKHEELYKNNFKTLISFLLEQNNKLEQQREKLKNRPEVKLSILMIKPFRYLKRLVRK